MIRRDAPRPVYGPSFGSHVVKIEGPFGGHRRYVKCRHCDFHRSVTGPDSKQAAREVADAHLLFTHETGSYLCGRNGQCCNACCAIRRLRRERGLPERITQRWQHSQVAGLIRPPDDDTPMIDGS